MDQNDKPPVGEEIQEISQFYRDLFDNHLTQPCLGDPHVMRNYIEFAEKLLRDMKKLDQRDRTPEENQKISEFIDRWSKEVPPQIRIFILMMESKIREMKMPGVWENLVEGQRQGVENSEKDIQELRRKYSIM